MLSKRLFITPFIIVKQDSKGKNSQTFPKTFPNASLGKYIPLVKHTSWTIILEIPEDAFSEEMHPIIIPIAINKIAMIIETGITKIMFIENCKPNIIAKMKNNAFCISMIGIIDNIYPNMYCIDFIGLIANLINNDVVLSLLISIAVKLSDRIGIMSKGELIDVGSSKELIERADVNNFEDAFVKIATGGEL